MDRALEQDRQSRTVLEAQRNLQNLFQQSVTSGVMDPNDEVSRQLIEGASVSLRLIEQTRKSLPEKIRALGTKTKDLGIVLVLEKWHKGATIDFDNDYISGIYTPETDNMTNKEFIGHVMEYNRWHTSKIK